MMGEYINREAAIAEMTADNLLDHFDSGEDAIEYRFHRAAERVLAGIPAADVMEVRHESWKNIGIMWIDKTNQPDGISTMFCPACERYATRIYYYGDPTDMMNYCPNCGAKMDGGQDDGE